MFAPDAMNHGARHAQELRQAARAPAGAFRGFDRQGRLDDLLRNLILDFGLATGAGALAFDAGETVLGEANPPAPRRFA